MRTRPFEQAHDELNRPFAEEVERAREARAAGFEPDSLLLGAQSLGGDGGDPRDDLVGLVAGDADPWRQWLDRLRKENPAFLDFIDSMCDDGLFDEAAQIVTAARVRKQMRRLPLSARRILESVSILEVAMRAPVLLPGLVVALRQLRNERLLRLLAEGKDVRPESGEKLHVNEETVRNMIQSILGGADEPTRTSENDASRWQPPPPPRRASPRLVDGPQVTQIRWSSRVAAYIPYPRVVEAPAEAVSTSACGYF